MNKTPSFTSAYRDWRYAELTVEQTRWFWTKQPIAKGKPPVDVPTSRGDLLRFCDSDSVACETYFRQHQHAVERAWWQQQALLFKGGAPPGAKGGAQPGGPVTGTERQQDRESSWEEFLVEEVYQGFPVVRSGMYEVDVYQRRLQSCFWPAPKHGVVRGTWFMERGSNDWLPLRENIADQLEEAYKGGVWNPKYRHVSPQPQGITAARIDLLTTDLKGLFALFVGPDEQYLCIDDSLSWLRKLGGGPGARLRRGYVAPVGPALAAEADLKNEELDDAHATAPVSSLVMVVHGIGQQLTAANIIIDCGVLRNVMNAAFQECFSSEVKSRGRVVVLPVQWRKQLSLDVDRLADVIQPSNVRALRQVAHATAVEVLLYMSPFYRKRVLVSLTDALNITYHRFIHRNPTFQGGITVVGHSLGSVLLYDILCHQPPRDPHSPPSGKADPNPQHLSTDVASGEGLQREPCNVIDLTGDSDGAEDVDMGIVSGDGALGPVSRDGAPRHTPQRVSALEDAGHVTSPMAEGSPTIEYQSPHSPNGDVHPHHSNPFLSPEGQFPVARHPINPFLSPNGSLETLPLASMADDHHDKDQDQGIVNAVGNISVPERVSGPASARVHAPGPAMNRGPLRAAAPAESLNVAPASAPDVEMAEAHNEDEGTKDAVSAADDPEQNHNGRPLDDASGEQHQETMPGQPGTASQGRRMEGQKVGGMASDLAMSDACASDSSAAFTEQAARKSASERDVEATLPSREVQTTLKPGQGPGETSASARQTDPTAQAALPSVGAAQNGIAERVSAQQQVGSSAAKKDVSGFEQLTGILTPHGAQCAAQQTHQETDKGTDQGTHNNVDRSTDAAALAQKVKALEKQLEALRDERDRLAERLLSHAQASSSNRQTDGQGPQHAGVHTDDSQDIGVTAQGDSDAHANEKSGSRDALSLSQPGQGQTDERPVTDQHEGSKSGDGGTDMGMALGLQQRLDIQRLEFGVDSFVMMGSPMPLFMVLRGVDPTTDHALGSPKAAALMPGPHCTPDGLPACTRMYNIYHPYDPVAYRLEPLVDLSMASNRPCLVPHKGGTRTHIAIQEFTEESASMVRNLPSMVTAALALNRFSKSVKRLEGSGTGERRSSGPGSNAEEPDQGTDVSGSSPPDGSGVFLQRPEVTPSGDSYTGAVEASKGAQGCTLAPTPALPSTGYQPVWRLTDGPLEIVSSRVAQGRLDFALQEGMTENQYLSALTSHFGYWDSPDVALFLLRAALRLPVLSRWAHEKLEQDSRAREAARKAAAEEVQQRRKASQHRKLTHTQSAMEEGRQQWKQQQGQQQTGQQANAMVQQLPPDLTDEVKAWLGVLEPS